MKNKKVARRIGHGDSLAGKRGTERVDAELVDKAQLDSSDETASKVVEAVQPSCVDAVHRFGKRSGST